MVSFRKIITGGLCVLLVCSMFVLGGCGQEEAQYSVFWSMDQSESPESAYMLHQLKDAFSPTEKIDQVDEDKETIFNTLTLEMSPGSQKTATFKIWNKLEIPDTKTTFKISADSDWITFPEKRIELTTPKQSEEKENQEDYEQQILAHVGSEVNIRSGATTKSDILLQTETYSTYLFLSKVIGEDDDMVWYEIELDDETIGWVRSDMATIKSADETKQTSQIISELGSFTTVTCEIVLPEDIKLPLESTITITPSNGEKTILKIKIIEPDWWSVKWVSSGTENLLINLYGGKPKQLGFEIKNDSIFDAEFEILSEDKNVYIEDIEPIALKAGESKSTLLWIRPDDTVEENTKIEELITITATKIIPKKEDQEQPADKTNTENKEEISESKQLHLEIILKRSYVKIVWEETGTDTITVEHYPYESVFRNIVVTNETGGDLRISTWNTEKDNYAIYYSHISIGEKTSVPIIIQGTAEKVCLQCTLLSCPYGSETETKTVELKINNKIKETTTKINYEKRWTIGENVIFTQHTDTKIIALIKTNDNDETRRKLQCFDNSTGQFLWEYPDKNNPDYKEITKSLRLEDISSVYKKVFIEYNKKFGNRNFDINCLCLDTNNGSILWSLESYNFLSVFGNTDKFLVTDPDYQGAYCVLYECRDINTTKTIWRECLEFYAFIRADDNHAIFSGDNLSGAGGGMFTKNNPPIRKELDIDRLLHTIYYILPHQDASDKYINNWSSTARDQYNYEIKSTENIFVHPQHGGYVGSYPYYTNNLIITPQFKCDESDPCSKFLFALHIHNSKTGTLVTNLVDVSDIVNTYVTNSNINLLQGIEYYEFDYYDFNSPYYNAEGDILEVGGYFFKIPSGEHIDLPTSYRLQHYSETTGNYYFLDTNGGKIVCVTLPDSQ